MFYRALPDVFGTVGPGNKNYPRGDLLSNQVPQKDIIFFDRIRTQKTQAIILAFAIILGLQGTVRWDVKDVRKWVQFFKRSVWFNYILVLLYFLSLKRHHHEKIKNWLQLLNNNGIETDRTLSLYPTKEAASLLLQFRNCISVHRPMILQYLYRSIISRCRCLTISRILLMYGPVLYCNIISQAQAPFYTLSITAHCSSYQIPHTYLVASNWLCGP